MLTMRPTMTIKDEKGRARAEISRFGWEGGERRKGREGTREDLGTIKLLGQPPMHIAITHKGDVSGRIKGEPGMGSEEAKAEREEENEREGGALHGPLGGTPIDKGLNVLQRSALRSDRHLALRVVLWTAHRIGEQTWRVLRLEPLAPVIVEVGLKVSRRHLLPNGAHQLLSEEELNITRRIRVGRGEGACMLHQKHYLRTTMRWDQEEEEKEKVRER